MRATSLVVVLACSLGAAAAQDRTDPDAARRDTLAALQAAQQDEAAALAAAAVVVALLRDADVHLRHRALAVVLQHPAAFREQGAAMRAALASAPDDSVLRALAVVGDLTALAVDDAVRMLGDPDQVERERALRSLERGGAALLPHLAAIVRCADRCDVARVLRTARVHDRAAVQQALVAAIAVPRAGQVRWVVKLLAEVGLSPAEQQPVLLACLDDRDGVVVARCTEVAKDDATFRAQIADVCEHGSAVAAANALKVMRALGPAAAEYWARIEPCLRSSVLLHDAAQVAVAVRTRCPEAVAAMIDTIRGAPDENAVVLAGTLRQCPEFARDATAVLAARLPMQWPPYVHAVLDALLVLDGRDELVAALPGLLTHREAEVRARACLLAVAIGAPTPALRDGVAAAAREADALVRTQAGFAARLLDGSATPGELADAMRDRDPYRVLAAWCAVRARHDEFTLLEGAGAGTLLVHPVLHPIALDALQRDLASRRIDATAAVQVLGGRRNELWFLQRLASTPEGAAVVVASLGDQRTDGLANAFLLDAARKDTALCELLASHGIALPEPTGNLAVPAWPRPEQRRQWLVDLGDPDADVRSLACERLSNQLPLRDTADEARRLRREGVASQRRCLAAVLQPMSVEAAIAATRAPEAFVIARGLEALVRDKSFDRTAAVALQEALRTLATRRDVWERLAMSWTAVDLLQRVASLGAEALPCLRNAFEVPQLRPRVLSVLPLLGPAARPFLPQVVAALRTRDGGAAACTLLTMDLAASDAEWAAVRDAVEAIWRQSSVIERRELLPALVALGEGAAFARADVGPLLADGLRGGFLSPAGLDEALRGWLQLALRGDVEVQRDVALLLLASASFGRLLPATSSSRGDGSDVVDALWRRAEGSTALRAAMQRLCTAAKGAELRELYGHLLAACAVGRPLPGTRTLLAAQPELVAELLARREPRELTPALLRELARSLPVLCARAMVRARAIDLVFGGGVELPASAAVVAELHETLLACDPAMRLPVARLLVAQGELALRVVRDELAADGVAAAPILDALAAAGSRAQWALPALRARLRAHDEHALRVASRLGAPGQAAVVDAVGDEAAEPFLVHAASANDAATVCAALRRLAESHREAALRAAESLRQHNDPTVRRWASLVLLPTLGADAAPAILRPLLGDVEPLLRRRALEVLAATEKWTDDLGVLATDRLTDGDPAVRRAAAAAFRVHVEEVPASRVALQEALAAEQDAAVAELLRAALGAK